MVLPARPACAADPGGCGSTAPGLAGRWVRRDRRRRRLHRSGGGYQRAKSELPGYSPSPIGTATALPAQAAEIAHYQRLADLSNRTALIAGSGRGIGKAIPCATRLYAKCGEIDIVVANAGLEIIDQAISDATEEQFDRLLAGDS